MKVFGSPLKREYAVGATTRGRVMKLYSYWRSSAAYRVRIALEYKNIPYQIVPIHLVKDGGEQRKDEYTAINPQKLVPTLVDGDLKLTQSMAIIEYLDEVQPTPSLLPEDTATRARLRSMAQLIACDIHPLDNLRVLQYLKNNLSVTDEQKSEWYAHWIVEGFSALETSLHTLPAFGPFTQGEDISLVETVLIPQIYNALRFEVSLKPYPRIAELYDACMARDEFKKAAPEAQVDAT